MNQKSSLREDSQFVSGVLTGNKATEVACEEEAYAGVDGSLHIGVGHIPAAPAPVDKHDPRTLPSSF